MIQQRCAICEKSNYTILYPENFDIKRIDEKTFSARRNPDRVHYRIVKCRECNLVYSNPILEPSKIEKLYRKSFQSYDSHVENLKKTYGHYLMELENYAVHKGKLLEIGCGSGFFLEEALLQGYDHVNGVEPSEKSVRSAKETTREKIVVNTFRAGLFQKNSFDVICSFQTFDHIPDPNIFLRECYTILKKGGLILFFNHNVSALSAKLLGENSPIIDIEHTYLYDKKTMKKILEKHGFTILQIKSALNIHNLGYFVQLFPLPDTIKQGLGKVLKLFHCDEITISMPIGNIIANARK